MNDHSHTPTSFLIDGVTHPALAMPLDPSWPAIAAAKGFRILGRVIDRYRCVLRCHACGTPAIVRVNVFRDHAPVCHACIASRRAEAAKAIEAQIIAADADNRHYAHFRLACGHIVRRQYLRVETAAAGGHAIDCEVCREVRYGSEALAFGWTLDGAPMSRRPGYRRYRHGCGHHQDVSIGNMLWGDASCGACAQNWAGKPSYIYVFKVDLPGLPVVKLGYSARPAKRLRHQLGIARGVRTEILRVLLLPSGNAAVREETACHGAMRTRYPDLIMPKAAFGDAINTQGEIYHAAALPLLHTLLDEIVQRRPEEAAVVEAGIPAMPATRASRRDCSPHVLRDARSGATSGVTVRARATADASRRASARPRAPRRP